MEDETDRADEHHAKERVAYLLERETMEKELCEWRVKAFDHEYERYAHTALQRES